MVSSPIHKRMMMRQLRLEYLAKQRQHWQVSNTLDTEEKIGSDYEATRRKQIASPIVTSLKTISPLDRVAP